MWDVTTRTNIATFWHAVELASVAFSPNGTTLASGAGDRMVKLWDLKTQTNFATLEEHTAGVSFGGIFT